MQKIKNMEKDMARRYNAYVNQTFNNPGRYAPFRQNNAGMNKLKKNLNAAIQKEGNSLAKDLRNSEINYKRLKNNLNMRLFNLRSKKYSHLFNDPRRSFGRQYPRLGNEGRPTLSQYDAEAKNLISQLIEPRKRWSF